FSSRRRHTRFSRDWSSDVCSSDLEVLAKIRALPNDSRLPPFLYLRIVVNEPRPELPTRIREAIETHSTHRRPLLVELRESLTGRSEERRVGKGGNAGWARAPPTKY